jgi:hypothetical protein
MEEPDILKALTNLRDRMKATANHPPPARLPLILSPAEVEYFKPVLEKYNVDYVSSIVSEEKS